MTIRDVYAEAYEALLQAGLPVTWLERELSLPPNPIRLGKWCLTRDGYQRPWAWQHEDYDGAPDARDNRAGEAQTIWEALAEIVERAEFEAGAVKHGGLIP